MGQMDWKSPKVYFEPISQTSFVKRLVSNQTRPSCHLEFLEQREYKIKVKQVAFILERVDTFKK